MGLKIVGIDNMSNDEINAELQRGAKFLLFEYCISVFIMTFKRSSSIYFVREGEGTIGKSIPFTMTSLLFGWWGIPWGPIYTIGSVFTNVRGGRDVTSEVLASSAASNVPRSGA